MQTRLTIAIPLVIILSACSSVTQAPLPTETLQPIIKPTFKKLPPISTPEPEDTPTFTPTVVVNAETSTLDWEGIPVIPGAYKGQSVDSSNYSYLVNITDKEAEQFYKEKMKAAGWTLSSHKIGPSTFGSSPIFLVFKKGNEQISILLMFNVTENFTAVMLGR